MLKLKKGLSNILEDENDSAHVADEPQLQPIQDSQQTANIQIRSTRQTTGVQLRPTAHEWEDLLIKLLAVAPEEVAYRLVSCLDTSLLIQILAEKRDDPYLRVALLLLSQKR
jgi:hypothetical protein